MSLLTLGIVLSAVDHLTPVLGNATDKLGGFDSKVSAVSANITKLGTASLAVGTAITAPLKSAYNDYQELAKAQGEIASLGIDDSGIKSITKSAREFTNEYAGTTAPAFVQASYDIKSGISSLSNTAVGEFTKISAMTAAATKSSTGQMTDLFATGYGIYRKQFEGFGAATIKGWNKLSEEEKDIKFGEYFSAGIANSVQAFKTDGSQMSAALSNLGASATSAGIDFAEQLSILGQLQSTMSGSEAATKYRAFLGSVSAAGDELDLQFTDANNQLLSMPDIITKIKDKYGESIDAIESAELKKAFGTEEAVALVKLLYNETDTLTANINSMNLSLQDGTAKTKEMAKATNKGKEWELLNQQINNVTTMIGSFFAPAAGFISTQIGGVVKSVGLWIDENEELASTIGLTVGVIGAALTGFGTIGVVVGAVGMALPVVSSGFGLVSGAVMFLGSTLLTVGKFFLANPIVLAVAGFAYAAYMIYDNWDGVKSFFSGLWDGVKSVFNTGVTFIQDYLGWTPLGMILNNWTPLTNFFSSLWDGVTNIFSIGWSAISEIGSSIINVIKAPFETFFTWIESKFKWVTNTVGAITNTVSGITSKIGDVTSSIGSSIKDKLKSASSFFTFEGGYKKEVPAAVSVKGTNKSIENIQKEVNTQGSTPLVKKQESKMINNTPTYNITVNNPNSGMDISKEIEKAERNRRNRQFEDID